MLGDVTAISTVLGAAPPADAEIARLRNFVRAACEAGLYLLLIEPGDKQPVDMRSSVQKKQDDAAAREVARAAGQPNWERAKSKGGVYLSSNDPDQLIKYLMRYRKTFGEDCAVNFGIDVGRSKLIVVDCDTAAQVQAFLTDFDAPTDLVPTVVTPGQRDADGNWAHKDGGHFYFTLDSPMPDYSGSLTAPGGYVLLWANRYVLIPPSVRPEGVYRLAGQDYPAPSRLVDMVNRAVTDRMTRHTEGIANSDLATAVDQWAAGVAWEDILAPAGWTLTARTDNCGCDIWTAPGDHASPKSATAHDVECTLGRYTVENAPLHIWTDYPGPELEAWMATHGKTVSRLQAVAALDYGGSVGDAMRGMSLMPDSSAELGFGSAADIGRDLGISNGNLDDPFDSPGDPEPEVDPPDPFDSPRGDTEQDTAPGDDTKAEEEKPISGVPEIQPFDYWRDFPAPEFAVEGLLEHRGFAALIGAPGVGKSGVALDLAAAICLGQRWMGRKTMRQPVLYLPGEGLSGAVQRIKAWEEAHEKDLGSDLLFGDSVIQIGASSEAWAAVVRKVMYYRVGLIIIDTFARASVGLEENSATDVGKAIARFDHVRKLTGAGLLVVHHTTKSGGTARGSSALNGALDTELLLRDGAWLGDIDPADAPDGRPLEMVVTKQKNAAQPDGALPMLAVPYGSSFVMTGPSGIVGDPLDAVVAPRALIPETVVSIAIRIQEFAQRFTTQGLTRGEIAYGIPPDDYTAARKDARTAWRMRVNEAVDLGLRYVMIQTLTGTATGARYVPGPTTPDQALDRWANEAV